MLNYIQDAGFDLVDITTNSVGIGFETGHRYKNVKIISEKEGFITIKYPNSKDHKIILSKNSIQKIEKAHRY